ncbi:MAG: response regulator [Sideroxydans sp.]|nr:response regulator [Sideroxydans sp.]
MQKKPEARTMADMIGGTKPSVVNEFIQFDKFSALVIDDIGAMRHALRSQLEWMGINSTKGVSNAEEALRQLEIHQFDLILCDYNLSRASSGQHFLEFLRNEHMLSAKTIFVMVTAEAEYAYVANAAEFAPDDYILKPCPEKKLRTRLERLFDRRNFLMPALTAMDAKDYARVVSECDKLLASASNDRWQMAALRLKAEAQHELHDVQNMLATYQQALALNDNVPWVKIGFARAQRMSGDLEAAEKSAREIIEQHPSYVAAYELLADIRLKQHDEEGAHELATRAAEILPTAKRFRTTSESAFLLGKLDEAKKFSQSAIKLSTGSITEKPEDYLALAQIQTDLGDPMGAIDTLERHARKYAERDEFGISKNAILAQAYFDSGDKDKAKKLVERAQRLMTDDNHGSETMNHLGKAALKLGDEILGLKMMTQAVQSSGKERHRVTRHVSKSMKDTGQHDKVAEVIDAGQRRILVLVDEAQKLMREAHFEQAYTKVKEALHIHDENIEALLAAAQLHLLWLKQQGWDEEIDERAKQYLATLDKLVPQNEKVMAFYRFYNQISGT